MRERSLYLLAAGMALTAACGSSRAGVPDRAPAPAPAVLAVTASDYAFDAPSTVRAGRVDVTFTNTGAEPHFAGFAKVAPGRTAADVGAALTAPPGGAAPSGPPPFEDYAGAPTTDPGNSAKLSFALPAGKYVLFCVLPSPDGRSHAVKGMLREIELTGEPSAATLPVAALSVTGTDFALTPVGKVAAGETALAFRNDGRQLHEVNLVELRDGTEVADVVAWYAGPAGPPPMTSLGGVAVKPGETGIARLVLRRGARYALVCAIPDVLGDFKPHLTKGMATPAFTAS